MVFPQHPEVDAAVGGGRDYRLIFPNSPRWRVEEDPGVGYFFMVASPEPLDLSAFDFDPGEGWDLSGVGGVVYEDPYVAIDDYVAAIIPDWEVVPYALDFLTYNVGDTHTYPRFLCYDCHGFQAYSAWNPYTYPCTSYQVVIWDDPYFYPSYRYAGTRVVVARPFGPRPRYGLTTRVAGAGWAPLVRTRVAPTRRPVVAYKEPARAPTYAPLNPVTRNPRATTPPRSAQRPTLQRRPSSPSARLPGRTPPGETRGSTTRSGAASGSRTPAAPTRAVPTPRTPPRGAATRGTTTRPPAGGTRSTFGATGSRVRPSQPARGSRAAPSRAPARGVPTRPSASPGNRPSATRRAPARPPTAGSRPTSGVRPPAARPPLASRPRQPARATGRPPASRRPAASARPPTRPTARPAPRRPAGRGGTPPRRPGG